MKRKRSAKASVRRKRWVIPDCTRFTGYKPCFPGSQCYLECVDPAPIGKRVLIINLDAMGNVLVTTSVLPAIKRKYPKSQITWLTLKNTAPLLMHIPLLDRVYVWAPENWMILQQMSFDVAMNVDKSQRSAAFMMGLQAEEKLGFGINENGVIIPLNKEAEENYILGLDDHLKFHLNQKTVSQLQCEQFKLKYARDEYAVTLSPEELAFCGKYRESSVKTPNAMVVGLNTGCSELYPNKKMSIEQHVRLIGMLQKIPGVTVALVGGPEDTQRNAEIVRQAGERVISTPTTEGVRRGLCYVNICDVVISGDTFGMHMAIGLKKHVIVWFGVSCSQEIDLYDRGLKLVPKGLDCSPCWKRDCPYNLECIQMIDFDKIVNEVQRLANRR